jgi:hypothetical protein
LINKKTAAKEPYNKTPEDIDTKKSKGGKTSF